MSIRSSLFILIIVGLASVSEKSVAASTYFGKAAVSYSTRTATEGESSDTTTRTMYDIGLYYRFSGGGGWCAGALYQNDAQGGDSSVNRTSYGVSGGWMAPRDSGFYLMATYFVVSTYGDYNEGNGYQADLGYKFTPKNIPIGLQLSYKNYTYSKFDHSDKLIDPYFVLMFDF